MTVMRTAPLRRHLWCQRAVDLGSSGCQRSGRGRFVTATQTAPLRQRLWRRRTVDLGGSGYQKGRREGCMAALRTAPLRRHFWYAWVVVQRRRAYAPDHGDAQAGGTLGADRGNTPRSDPGPIEVEAIQNHVFSLTSIRSEHGHRLQHSVSDFRCGGTHNRAGAP